MTRNVRLYPWFQFFRNLTFWQAVWFLFFQERLSGSEAILLYVVFDVATTALEVPSGYMSDRVGRRITLITATLCGGAGGMLLVLGDSFAAFALAQVFLGAAGAFASGTDSSLLYESLAREGRSDEVELHELRAWRFSFTALALSALLGGAMAEYAGWLPFLAGAVAMGAAAMVALAFREPPHVDERSRAAHASGFARSMRGYLRNPTLRWLFGLAVAMYGFSHVPFVFGQPFILEALETAGHGADAAIVSGAVTSVMMVVSVGTSWLAPALRRAIGVGGVLLLAFSMQIGLIGVLAVTNDALAIAFLLLRMVPNSLSAPLMIARIQPLLADRSRATFLSLKSFSGRLVFAATLLVFSATAPGEGMLPYTEIQEILTWYAAAGVLVFCALAATAKALDRHA